MESPFYDMECVINQLKKENKEMKMLIVDILILLEKYGYIKTEVK